MFFDKVKFGGDNNLFGEHNFLLKLEDDDDTLKIVFSSVVGDKCIAGQEEYNETIKKLLNENITIQFDKEDVYEIIFSSYIIYQVRKESFCSWDDYEIRKGKCLHIYEKSRLLEHCKATMDSGLLPDKWVHYGVSTENHIIDIISHEKPTIKKIY